MRVCCDRACREEVNGIQGMVVALHDIVGRCSIISLGRSLCVSLRVLRIVLLVVVTLFMVCVWGGGGGETGERKEREVVEGKDVSMTKVGKKKWKKHFI